MGVAGNFEEKNYATGDLLSSEIGNAMLTRESKLIEDEHDEKSMGFETYHELRGWGPVVNLKFVFQSLIWEVPGFENSERGTIKQQSTECHGSCGGKKTEGLAMNGTGNYQWNFHHGKWESKLIFQISKGENSGSRTSMDSIHGLLGMGRSRRKCFGIPKLRRPWSRDCEYTKFRYIQHSKDFQMRMTCGIEGFGGGNTKSAWNPHMRDFSFQ